MDPELGPAEGVLFGSGEGERGPGSGFTGGECGAGDVWAEGPEVEPEPVVLEPDSEREPLVVASGQAALEEPAREPLFGEPPEAVPLLGGPERDRGPLVGEPGRRRGERGPEERAPGGERASSSSDASRLGFSPPGFAITVSGWGKCRCPLTL